MASDDDDLIRRALQGDHAAFAQLVRRYEDRLFKIVVRVVDSKEQAEDIIQETFVTAFLTLSGYKFDCQFFTWLYRIAYNTAIQYKRNEAEKTDPDDPNHPKPVRGVLDALAQLPPEELDAMKYQTIAEILGVPIETVRRRLLRARSPTDSELVALAKNGDHAAFAELMHRYRPHIIDMIAGLAEKPEDRTVLRARVFLNSFQRLETYDGSIPFVSWLYRIVVATVEELRSDQ